MWMDALFFLQAARAFETLRSIEPHRLQGLEYYSTALWHLQREVSLSALAQDMMDLDKTAPEVRDCLVRLEIWLILDMI